MRLILIFLLIVNLAFSDDDYKDYKEGFHIPRDLSYLHLTTKQKEKFKKILKEYRVVLKNLHEEEESIETELKRVFLQDRFDKRAFMKKKVKVKNKIAKTEAEFFAKIHRVLTKKQRKKFIKYLEEWEIE